MGKRCCAPSTFLNTHYVKAFFSPSQTSRRHSRSQRRGSLNRASTHQSIILSELEGFSLKCVLKKIFEKLFLLSKPSHRFELNSPCKCLREQHEVHPFHSPTHWLIDIYSHFWVCLPLKHHNLILQSSDLFPANVLTPKYVNVSLRRRMKLSFGGSPNAKRFKHICEMVFIAFKFIWWWNINSHEK